MRLAKGFGILFLVLVFVVAACGSRGPTPTPGAITVTDDEGRSLSLAGPPQRIISLGPSNTEVLYALGAGDRIVGVDDFSDYPPEAKEKKKVGAPFPSFNLEAIVALAPDLVLSVPLVDFNDRLRQQGVQVLVLDPSTLDEIFDDIRVVGRVVGAGPRAEELVAEMKKRVEAVTEKVRGAPRVRAFYEVDATDPTKPYTAGPGSFVHEMIVLAGGENVAADAQSPYPQFSLEQVVSRNPQVVLLGDALVPFNPQTPELVASRPGWGSIAAVKDNRLVAVDGDLTTRPGPRIVEGLEAIARALHPELFR